MAFLLCWLGSGAILLRWLINRANAYWSAIRLSEGLDSRLMGSGVFIGGEYLGELFRRQGSPHLESLRRRVWIAASTWLAYMLLGGWFWTTVVRLVGAGP